MVGTLFITWCETLSYSTRMGFLPGASVLAIAPGGNGLAFLFLARKYGATCLAMVVSAARQIPAALPVANEYHDFAGRTAGKPWRAGSTSSSILSARSRTFNVANPA
jgi:hypothetical protein